MSKIRRLRSVSKFMAGGKGIILKTTPEPVFKGSGNIDYVCAKCGEILMKDMDGIPNIIANIECSTCHTISDINKLLKYQKDKIIEDFETGLKTPIEYIEDYHKIFPLENEFDSLSNSFEDFQMEMQGDRPKMIYHYTDSGGLSGILKSGRFWATGSGYLNDKTEITHAKSIIRSVIKECNGKYNSLGDEILKGIEHEYRDEVIDNEYYIVCFCEDGDLLSQWRAYASNGVGFSIGINANVIGQINPDEHVRFVKVNYDEESQVSYVKKVIEKTLELAVKYYQVDFTASTLDNNIVATICSFISANLTFCKFAFKNNSFSEEKEWRVIIRPKSSNRLKFRNNINGIIPYLECDLDTTTKNYPLLPVYEIISGPVQDKARAGNSIKLLLEDLDYSMVSYRHSKSTYRP